MISILWILLDVSLAGMLLGLAWAATNTRDMQRAIILFVALGLLLTLTWARLQAPDLALAEAAIGAGIAGALLLAALREEPATSRETSPPDGPVRTAVNTGCFALFLIVSWGLLDALGSGGARLADITLAAVPESGVSHPVTAVLLNFRAYDTLLELAVVLSAVLGIIALGPSRPAFQKAPPLLFNLIRWLVPLLIVTAGYLLWVGAHAPGGAFQAGATLAAAGILLRLGGHARGGLPGNSAIRWLLVVGVATFVLTGLILMRGQGTFLQYPSDIAGALILLIEAAATLSIAAALIVAYIGGRLSDWDQDEPSDAAGGSSDTQVRH